MTDTPETDAAVIAAGGDWSPVLRAVAQRLERERNGARELAEAFHRDHVTLLLERDEARAERDILRLDAQSEAEHHDRMVGELEKAYKERDEAREDLEFRRGLYKVQEQCLETARRERDEARKLLKQIGNPTNPL